MSTAALETMTIAEELKEIRAMNGGTIPPRAVVNYARDPSTRLHSRFTWDDSEAAEQYRLWQARQVLRVYVNVEMPERKNPVRVRPIVSLPSDRKAGNGYRMLADVMENEDYRLEMLDMAKRELSAFRKKYKTLSELSEVHNAIDSILGNEW